MAAPRLVWIYLAVAGLLLVGSVMLERSAYRPKMTGRGSWQMTGERFRDPASGALMEVRYNPVTGERDYVEVAASAAAPDGNPRPRGANPPR